MDVPGERHWKLWRNQEFCRPSRGHGGCCRGQYYIKKGTEDIGRPTRKHGCCCRGQYPTDYKDIKKGRGIFIDFHPSMDLAVEVRYTWDF